MSKASVRAIIEDRNPNPDCYELLAPYYEEIYANIDATETVRQWWQLLVSSKVILERPETLRLLDIGCGPGLQLNAWRELGFKVSGLDSSPALLERARALLGQQTDLYLTDILEPACFPVLPSFDLVVSHFNFLNMFAPEQRDRLFTSVARLVRPGGVWIADFADPCSPPEPVEERIELSKGILVRTGKFDSQRGYYEQHWEGPNFCCDEQYWFGHRTEAPAVALRTGWQLFLRKAWHPYAPEAAWQDPSNYDEVLVDIYMRLGGATE